MKIKISVLFLLLVTFKSLLSADTIENASIAYEVGNYVESAKLYRKACNSGDVQGCLALASMYELGDGVKQNNSMALKLYSKSCSAGSATGCNGLGFMYASGIGVKIDKFKAAKFYYKSCYYGLEKGCENYTKLTNKSIEHPI